MTTLMISLVALGLSVANLIVTIRNRKEVEEVE
jgi:hypothetical protein